MARRLRLAVWLALTFLIAMPAHADFESGMASFSAGDLEDSFAIFLPLAEAGDAGAQNQVGVMFGAGLGVPRDDMAAAAWFEKAAAQGNERARGNLARLHLLGLGVPRDPAKAASLFKRAAMSGYVKAQAALGNLYARGQGVPKDFLRAHFWWSLASQQGDHESLVGREDMASMMTPHQIRVGNLLYERFLPVPPSP